MARFENISHGEANWEQKVNKNFSNVTQDSGWQKLTILAPATGDVMFRVLNGVCYFLNTVRPNAAGNVDVALFPNNELNRGIITLMNGATALGTGYINNGKITLTSIDENHSSASYALDPVSFVLGSNELPVM